MDQNTENVSIKKDDKSLLNISPQGIAILVLIALMIFLQRINPFLKFTRTILKAQRYLYITLFVLFLVVVSLFYAYDPFGIVKPYWQWFTPVIIFFGVFLLAVIFWYTYEFTDSDVFQSREDSKPKPIQSFFIKLAIILGTFGMVIALVSWVIINANKLSGAPGYIASLIVNILLIIAILGFVWNVLSKSSILQSSPYTRLIVNFILYIPCIFVNIIDALVKAYYNEKQETKRADIVASIIIVIIFTLYFIIPYVIQTVYRFLQGGKLLLNEPVSLSNKTPLAGYLKLNDIPEDEDYIPFTYNYALSTWVYVYGTGNTNSTFNELTPILDYGGKPTIYYKAYDNTVRVTVKLSNEKPDFLADNLETDENGNVIIYEAKDMKLQKWNNFIINYQEGVMDIFLNGDLVKSVSNLVPYMSMDLLSVGNSPGINGQICNVMYYNYGLDIERIKYLYNSVKDDTPPVVPFSESNSSLLN